MTPAELKANVDRFNEAGQAAAEALDGIKTFVSTHGIDDELSRLLELYTASVSVMLDTSSELVGVTGPTAAGPKA